MSLGIKFQLSALKLNEIEPSTASTELYSQFQYPSSPSIRIPTPSNSTPLARPMLSNFL